MSVPTCFHTSTIPYGLSLKANLMSLIDRRGTRADQTNSPQETPTNSLTSETRGCEQALECVLRALAERGARRRAASGARRPAARALRVAHPARRWRSPQAQRRSWRRRRCSPARPCEHADEGVQVAGPLLLVVPVELAAEHFRRHLEQLACGSTAQPLAGGLRGCMSTRICT